jgi:hypothetical protein
MPTIYDIAQSILIYYGVSAVLLLLLVRPGGKAWSKLSEHPSFSSRPEASLIILLHALVPILIAGLLVVLFPRRLWRASRNFCRRQAVRWKLFLALLQASPAGKKAVRKFRSQLSPGDLQKIDHRKITAHAFDKAAAEHPVAKSEEP